MPFMIQVIKKDCDIDLHTYRRMSGGGSSTFGAHLRQR